MVRSDVLVMPNEIVKITPIVSHKRKPMRFWNW